MKKILIATSILFLIVGCTGVEKTLKSNYDITGLWVKIEENTNGKIIDYTNNKNSYLEITSDNMSFYSYYSDTGAHAVSNQFYKFKNNTLYVDYEEFENNNWENQIKKSPYGSIYIVDVKEDKMILKEKRVDDIKAFTTYQKITRDEFPIIEE